MVANLHVDNQPINVVINTLYSKAYKDVMTIIWKRLDDRDKKWRHAYKVCSLCKADHYY